MQWKRGTTREVILIGRWAFKFPSVRSWSLFLKGLLANMQEFQFRNMDQDFCPVVFSIRGGFAIVMPRCESLTETEFEDYLRDRALPAHSLIPWMVEGKPCSYGKLNGKIVAVDYGS